MEKNIWDHIVIDGSAGLLWLLNMLYLQRDESSRQSPATYMLSYFFPPTPWTTLQGVLIHCSDCLNGATRGCSEIPSFILNNSGEFQTGHCAAFFQGSSWAN